VAFNLGYDTAGQIISRVVVESYVGTFARKNIAKRCANTARTTGYERALTFEQ